MRNLTVIGLLAAFVAWLCWAPTAAAQPGGFGGDITVSAEGWWAPRQAEEGPLVAFVAVTMDHPPGLKSWPSADQDVLPEDIAAFAIRTEIGVAQGGAVRGVGQIQWPSPKPYPVPDVSGMGGTVEVPVYAGKAVAFVPVLVDRDAAQQPQGLSVTIAYQVCDEAVCYPPVDAEFVVQLPAFGSDAVPPVAQSLDAGTVDGAIALAVASAVSGAEPIQPEPVQPEPLQPEPLQEDQADAAGEAPAPAPQAAVDTRNKFLGFIPVPSPDSAGGIAVVVLMGIVGGFVLNLTPCVLPVIPIKVMTISQHAGTPGKTLMLGLWMALGVVAFWVGLGVPAALLGKAVGAIFGIWWFTVGIGIIIAVMSLGLMGLFTVQLPQSVYKVNPKADSPWGSFVFGVMTGVLGLPCFGLVAGALLASSTAIPPAVTMLIFTALGVGMALPYLILSLNPKWVDVLPRTGPASELVKQVMGLLLLAAGAYFLATGLQALILDMPWIGRQLHWWAVAVFVALACFWLVVRTLQITKSVPKRGVFTILGVLAGSASLMFAWDATQKAKSDYLEQERQIAQARAQSGESAIITSTWVDYEPGLLERAREAGYVVVVDFTADWCLNCKALKAAVLEVEPVRSRLRSDDVVMIKADLTSTRQPAWALMRELNQKAPPVLAVYGPGIEGQTPWMANTYTSGSVMDAIALGKGDAGDGPASQDIARAN